MSTTRNLATAARLPVRCHTRAMKNAQFLKKMEPKTFGATPSAEGFGTGLPLEVLRRIHRLRPDAMELRGYPQVSEFLKKHKMPVPGRNARDPLFNGTVHFAQVTFQTNTGNLVTSSADMRGHPEGPIGPIAMVNCIVSVPGNRIDLSFPLLPML